MNEPSLVDIIIPVYKGFDETRKCINSVLSGDLSLCDKVVVINDASPDVDVVAYCEKLPEKVMVIHNKENIGFVASVNKGMRLSQTNDVILLNSDCQVYGDWVKRLQQCAYSDETAATVTPFTNNGTICSYPVFNNSNVIPDDTDLEHIDSLFKKVNTRKKQEIPTAVGFCMYIKRNCLDDIGLFDESLFGLGYGEENDFCLRSSRRGWKHYLSADTYVYHQGSVSFGDKKYAQMERAEKILVDLYPEYCSMVESFIITDPLRVYRDAVDDSRGISVKAYANIVREQRSYRDKILDSMQEYVKSVSALKAEIENYSKYLVAARDELATYDKALKKVEGIANEYFKSSQNLENKLEKTIHKYEKIIADKNFQLDKLNEDFLSEKYELLHKYEVANEEISQLVISLQSYQKHIDEMVSSRSWRYTKWLRWLSEKMVKNV